VGSALLTVGLAGVVYALIEGPGGAWDAATVAIGVVGVLALVVFILVEARIANPMVPLEVFKSQQFSGANAVTFAVYAALGTVTFLLVVHLQTDLGYSALEAGAALLPITACMLLLSARSGALAQRIGPRWPMTIGPLIVAVGMALLGRVDPGTTYWETVFPALVVLGLGLALTVAPLTATVLGAVDDSHAGIASAINNSVARIAGLLAVAVLPAAAGLTAAQGLDLDAGFSKAMYIAAVLSAVGGVLAFFTIRRAAFVAPVVHANPATPCYSTEADVAGSAA
jgi:predicted MFS family arabinose efflux permease